MKPARHLMARIITLALLAATAPVQAQDLVWATRGGGSTWDETRDIAVLADGSALVIGNFMGTATFGPGEPGQTLLTSAGDEDIFVARYNPDGTLAWAKRAGGSHGLGDYGSGIAVLSDGSALFTGRFNGTATFGPGEPGQTLLTSAGSSDIFFARYNPDGTLAWAKRAGGSGGEGGSGIAVLADGSSLVTGGFSGTATFGPGEPGETTLTTPVNGHDIFVARYNPDGTLAWARRAGSTNWQGGSAIAVLADGSALVTGDFTGTVTFGPGEPGETTLTAGDNDIFVARYNPDGTLAWARRAGGTGWQGGSGIAVLADGSSLVTGGFYAAATFGPGEPGQTLLTSAGSSDIFFARYNPDGTLAWARRAGGSIREAGRGIAVLADGSALVTGFFNGTATFGPGEPGQTYLTSAGDSDIFVARFAGLTTAVEGWEVYR